MCENGRCNRMAPRAVQKSWPMPNWEALMMGGQAVVMLFCRKRQAGKMNASRRRAPIMLLPGQQYQRGKYEKLGGAAAKSDVTFGSDVVVFRLVRCRSSR